MYSIDTLYVTGSFTPNGALAMIEYMRKPQEHISLKGRTELHLSHSVSKPP